MSEERIQVLAGSRWALSRWLIVALLGVIAACLLIEVGAATSAARGEVTSGQGGKLFAVAGQISPGTFGLYLVDLENSTISVYQYVSTDKRLRLVAARNVLFDRQLDEYNTQPSPREIKTLIGQQKRLSEEPATAPAP